MEIRHQERFDSGDPGLDRILEGGLLKHGTHIVSGLPGTGKTILTQQIGFHIAKQGRQVVTITALAESHERLISHLENFNFFDSGLVGSKVYYLSASRIFIEQGLLPSLHELRQLISSPRPDVLIFEGLSAVGGLSSGIEFRRFLYELNAHLMLMSCMGIFICDFDPVRYCNGPEYALADTVLLLHRRDQAQRHIRELEVVKSRGTDAITGLHTFEIHNQGITVYPRLEAIEGRAQPPAGEPARKSFGIPALDSTLGGGLSSGSTTMLIGTPGIGKTLLSTQFVAQGAAEGERGLIWSFHEPADVITRKAEGIGLQLGSLVERGLVQIEWRPPLELLIDKEFYLLLQAVESGTIRRLVIDPFDPFWELATESGRSFNILMALANTLRSRNTTTIVNTELRMQANAALEPAALPLLGAADNTVLLRYAEQEQRLTRNLVVLKKREGEYDSTIREFLISDAGFKFPGYQPNS